MWEHAESIEEVALVTGAGSGIGKAITIALSAPKRQLWLAGRALERLEAVAEAAASAGSPVRSMQIDLECDEAIFDLATCIRKEAGYIDLLIHCAGYIGMGRLESASVGEFDRHYRINVRAPYLLTQLMLPMLRKRSGQIVFVNSSAGMTAGANLSQYAASKHALRAIADSLRQEVNADGIRVVSVYPGRTASRMQAAVHAMEGKDYDPARLMQPEDVAAVVVNVLQLPRTAEVTDIHVRPFLKPR